MRDPLPSWRGGAVKRRLLEAVHELSMQTPPAERVAAFDNDGTLWCEQPNYVQAFFLMARWQEMVAEDPDLARREPFRSAATAGPHDFAGAYGQLRELTAGLAAAYQGVTVDEFAVAARHFFTAARHPRFDVPFTALTYRPMRELMDLLRDKGFTVFILAGGGRDFVRVISENTFGIPAHHVIGAAPGLKFTDGCLSHTAQPSHALDDGPGKAVHMFEHTGFLPAFAAGNADGDVELLQSARFCLVLRHDDAHREYAYHTQTEQIQALAEEEGWLNVSMREDFASVFDPVVPLETTEFRRLAHSGVSATTR